MDFFISDAMAQSSVTGDAGLSLLFLIGMFVIMYFLLIRPQVKRQKQHKAMVDTLKKGDEVQTMGGLMGKITDLGDNFMKVEVADNVIVTVRRSAVEIVMPKGSLKEL